MLILQLLQTQSIFIFSMIKSQQRQKQPLLSESKKHPTLFRLKVIALVVTILIAIIGIVDLVLLLYISNNPEPTANLSFVNSIITNTSIITQTQTIRHLLSNMLKANPTFYFQESSLMAKKAGTQFTRQVLVEQIFRQESKDLLFLFKVKNTNSTFGQQHLFAVFVTSSFPLPKEDDYKKQVDYYTFQSGDDRKSMILSLQNDQFLIMNSTTERTTFKQCKTYVLSQQTNSFGLLSLLNTTLDSSPAFTFMNLDISYQCFDKVESKQKLITKLNSIVGFNIQENELEIVNFQVYFLTNDI